MHAFIHSLTHSLTHERERDMASAINHVGYNKSVVCWYRSSSAEEVMYRRCLAAPRCSSLPPLSPVACFSSSSCGWWGGKVGVGRLGNGAVGGEELVLWKKGRVSSVVVVVVAEDGVRAQSSTSSSASVAQEEIDDNTVVFNTLTDAIARKDTDAVKKILDQLQQEGWAKQWSSVPNLSCRATYNRELTSLGIKNAENLAVPSVQNDAAFLATVVGTTGFLAVLAGQLPGDWGFFVPYLLGSISLVVLAIGSTAPGLLQVAINSFSSVFPDYKERLLRHEAAHFLVAYLLGLPVLGYSLDIGKEHVNLINESLQKRIYEGSLDDKELDRLAVVSMAGIAAEGLNFDKVVGQSADLFSLQRLINRSKPKLSNEQQQNLTRWAVLYAASLLKNNVNLYESLMSAMSKSYSVFECIQAIEKPTNI